MEAISILNDVLGPVMRGPSSSHTAGAYRIARMARDLLGAPPRTVEVAFDEGGSYGRVYREQGAGRAFACGFLGREITDSRYESVLDDALEAGLALRFTTVSLPRADHPNSLRLVMEGEGDRGKLELEARSVGGGMVEITRIQGFPVLLDGKFWEVVASGRGASARQKVLDLFHARAVRTKVPGPTGKGDAWAVSGSFAEPVPEVSEMIRSLSSVSGVYGCAPVVAVPRGKPRFDTMEEMLRLAAESGGSLAAAARRYEADILGWTENEVIREVRARWRVMRASVACGFDEHRVHMRLLASSAPALRTKERSGGLAVGGIGSAAAVRALAAMHTCNSGGVVCAAPTGGSAGTIPGTLTALMDERGVSETRIVDALLAAGAVGWLVARRATFAAEICGCQVEIGAAGAMAAAAVVEISGGSAAQACDAAAIALQNTMGSVCDLVQGICEIPCHTRNGAAAAAAYVCADLVMGGYHNPIPLDETIDAVYAVGRQMPMELKVTALGGLAQCPSARALPRRRE